MLNTWALNSCLLNALPDAGAPVVTEPGNPQVPSIELQGLQVALILGEPRLKAITVSSPIGELRALVRCPIHTLVPIAQLHGLSVPATLGYFNARSFAEVHRLRVQPILAKGQFGPIATAFPLSAKVRLGALKAVMPDAQMQGLQILICADGLHLRSMVQVPPLYVRAKLHGPTVRTEVCACRL